LRVRGLATPSAVCAPAFERALGRTDSAASRAGRGGPSRPGSRGGLDRRRMALPPRALGVGARTLGHGAGWSVLFAMGHRAWAGWRALLRAGRVARHERQRGG